MHTIHFLASAIPNDWKDPLPCEPAEGVCCFTGETCLTIPRTKLLTSTFTDHLAYAAPTSDRVSVDAWNVFKAGYYSTDTETGALKERKKKVETMSCWWTNGKSWEIEIDRNKQRIRELLFTPPASQWAAYITKTYKKHGSLRSPVNSAPFGRWGFDDQVVDASSRDRVCEWWKHIRTAQEQGIPRPLIESVNEWGGIHHDLLTVWFQYVAWARSRRNDPLYAFLCYLMPSKEELKNGYTDDHSIQKEVPMSRQQQPTQGVLF